MWELLLIAIFVAFLLLKRRETIEPFVLKYGNPFDGEDILSFDPGAKGTRLFSTTPDTCPLDRPVLDAGLCYPECDEGYHGVATMCWADTVNIGPGTLAEFKSCDEMTADGWTGIDMGLHCWNPPACETVTTSEWSWTEGGFLRTRCWGGETRVKGLKCPGRSTVAAFISLVTSAIGITKNPNEYVDLVDGMCYTKCPEDAPHHIPGMPYLCTKGARGLSYDRGAGTVPPLFHFGA